MAGALLVLEAVKNGPAFHVGQIDVERDRVGAIPLRELQSALTTGGHQAFEPLGPCHVQQDAGEGDVVLDDHDHPVALLDVVAVIGYLLFDHHAAWLINQSRGCALTRLHERRRGLALERATFPCRTFALAGEHVLHCADTIVLAPVDRGHVTLRQVESEARTKAFLARHADLAAQQSRDLAADGQAEAGATVLPCGRCVRLLERLEDDPLLLVGDSDARI